MNSYFNYRTRQVKGTSEEMMSSGTSEVQDEQMNKKGAEKCRSIRRVE